MLLCAAEHHHSMFFTSLLPLDYYLTTSECSFRWGAVAVFYSSLNVDCVYRLAPTL